MDISDIFIVNTYFTQGVAYNINLGYYYSKSMII